MGRTMADGDRISTLEHLRVVMDQRFLALDKELGLYREEMQRRLAALNELRSEVTKDREMLLPRGEFTIWARERDTWREQANARLTAIEASHRGRASAGKDWLAVVSIIFSAITLIILLVHFSLGVLR